MCDDSDHQDLNLTPQIFEIRKRLTPEQEI